MRFTVNYKGHYFDGDYNGWNSYNTNNLDAALSDYFNFKMMKYNCSIFDNEEQIIIASC